MNELNKMFRVFISTLLEVFLAMMVFVLFAQIIDTDYKNKDYGVFWLVIPLTVLLLILVQFAFPDKEASKNQTGPDISPCDPPDARWIS